MKMNPIAFLLSMLGGTVRPVERSMIAVRQAGKMVARWRSFSRSKYMPHQGGREKARRVGGETWQNFLAAERAARGLHARA